jgi:hypothetical protein
MEALTVVAMVLFAVLTALAVRDLPPRPSAARGLPICEAAAPELGLTRRGERFVRSLEDQLELELGGVPETGQLGERITAHLRLLQPVATELRVVPHPGHGPASVSVSFDFDQRFRVSSPRPERAARLLREALGRKLVEADALGFSVELGSDQIKLVGRWITKIAEVKTLASSAVLLGRALIAAEAALPRLLPWGPIARSWRAAAERLDAQFDPESRSVAKQAGPYRLWMHAGTQREEQWFAELEVQLERPLPVRFELSNESARTLWQRLTVRDIELGDRAFDDAFFISSDQPDAVRSLLDDETRKALVDLERRTGTLQVTPSAIRGRFEGAAVLDLERLVRIGEAALAAADALVLASRTGGSSAYR